MVSRTLPALWLICGGCWLNAGEVANRINYRADVDTDTDADTDTDTDTDTDLDSIRVSSVTPSFGTQDGGTEVIIQASPIDDSVHVQFGKQEAVVTQVSGSTVTVMAPVGLREGEVDVDVFTATAAGSAPKAYDYWAPGAGKTAALGAIHLETFQGGYWANDLAKGSGWFFFSKPIKVSYSDLWGSSMNSCESGYFFDTEGLVRYPVGGSTSLVSGAATLDFQWSDVLRTYVTDFDVSEFKSTAGYDLEPVSGAQVRWPEMSVPDFARTASPIRILSPYVDGAEAGYLSTTNLLLEWDNPGGGDYVVAAIDRWVWQVDGYVWMEQVRCLLDDDGSYSVPRTVWQGWESVETQYLAISLGRVAETNATLPHNGGRSAMGGLYWANGAVFTGP